MGKADTLRVVDKKGNREAARQLAAMNKANLQRQSTKLSIRFIRGGIEFEHTTKKG